MRYINNLKTFQKQIFAYRNDSKSKYIQYDSEQGIKTVVLQTSWEVSPSEVLKE